MVKIVSKFDGLSAAEILDRKRMTRRHLSCVFGAELYLAQGTEKEVRKVIVDGRTENWLD